MHLKTKLFGLVAALGLCLGLVGQASATNTTTVAVTLTDAGSFSLDFGGTVVFPSGSQICPASTGFGSAAVSLSAGATVTGSICLVYTDTQTYRSTFHVDLSATNFNSGLAVPVPGTGNYFIPNKNLTLVTNYNPAQVRWSHMTPTPTNPVGDIGATTDSGGNLGNNPSATWTGSNTFDLSRKVSTAYAGTGTIGTMQQIDLSVAVPAAMPAATYTSTLVATVVLGTP